MGVELEGGGEVGGEVGPVVGAGVEMKFVRDFAGDEKVVKGLGAAVKAVGIARAAIEINFQVALLEQPEIGRIANDGEGAFLTPVGGIEWRAESGTEKHGDAHSLSV